MTIRSVVSEHREVVLAVTILASVLLVIDVASLREPALVLSLAPLAFMVLAGLVPLTPRRAAIWIGGIALVAIVAWDARYVGLAYPALIVSLLLVAHRRHQKRA